MTKEISDEVVHEFCAVGRHDQIHSAIQQRFGGAVDVLALPADTPPELAQELRRIS